jgi:hypothetical protein
MWMNFRCVKMFNRHSSQMCEDVNHILFATTGGIYEWISQAHYSFFTTRAKGFCGENFHHKSLFFRHKLTFVATFKIATSRHKYWPHKYSSDDFLFPTNGCTH